MKKSSRGSAVLALGLLGACSAEPAQDRAAREVPESVLVLEQAYEVPAADVWKAAAAALEGEEFKVERRRRDDYGGKIVARREDGHRVTVTIHAPERAPAEVTIVVEPADRGLLDTIQRRLEEKLSLKKARAELLGDTVQESSYEVDLGTALLAAERACHVLALEVKLLRRDPERARLEARDRDGRSLRFTMHETDGASPETEIVISIPEAWGGEKELLRQVRRELERHLFPSSP